MNKKTDSSNYELYSTKKRKKLIKKLLSVLKFIFFFVLMYVGLHYINKYYNAGQLSCTQAQNIARLLISTMITSMFISFLIVSGNKGFQNKDKSFKLLFSGIIFVLSRFFTGAGILFTPYRFCNYEYNTPDGKKNTEIVNINNNFIHNI